jgi:hypothetical protein
MASATALVEHGRFLEAHLEDRGLVVGTHLVGELVGLYACGAALRAAGGEAASWRRAAREGLEREAREQVLADGGGAEGSTGYARFLAELLVAAQACARAAAEPPLLAVEDATRCMLSWLAATMSPDGRDLGIGDDDASRVLPGARAVRDLTALIPLTAAGDLATRPEEVAWSEVAGWMLGLAGQARWEAARPEPWAGALRVVELRALRSRRAGAAAIWWRCAPARTGKLGAGGHAHNDPLALNVWFDGRPAIIDPGHGPLLGRPRCAIASAAWRRTARCASTGSSPRRSCRRVPSPCRPRLGPRGQHRRPRRMLAHHCPARGLPARRRHPPPRGALAARRRRRHVTDELLGRGSHDVAINFPLASADAPVTLATGERDREMPTFRHDPGLVSPEYGSLESSVVARRMGRVQLPVTLTTILTRR